MYILQHSFSTAGPKFVYLIIHLWSPLSSGLPWLHKHVDATNYREPSGKLELGWGIIVTKIARRDRRSIAIYLSLAIYFLTGTGDRSEFLVE